MPENRIHPTAIVSTGAHLAGGVEVGPYAIINDHVHIGENTVIGPHAVINSYVRMGRNNRVHAHAVIGDLPQDVAFDPATETWVEIGENNTLRENVTIHRATSPANPTTLGSYNYIMAYTHIGHDCKVGDRVILTSFVGLSGHTTVENNAVIGGSAVVHQFCRIGQFAMVAGFIAVRKDIMPYTMVAGESAKHYRLNTVGLRRSGIKGERYHNLERAFRAVRSGDKSLHGIADTEEVVYLREWLAQHSKRGLGGFLRENR
jgi:UDP-N-acetylglucosamine acyltransferase